MISIVIPTYNDADNLKKALQSIHDQTYADYQIIVIDDGSENSYKEIITQFKKTFPSLYYERIAHGGANTARQRGAEVADGEFIIFWDADVLAQPNMLERMVETLNAHPEASYAYSSHMFGRKAFKLWPFDAQRLRAMPYIHTTSLIRREHFTGFDPQIKRLQDWDLWLSMLEKGYTGVYIPEYLFTVTPGGTMSSWLPKYVFKWPFKYLLPKSVRQKSKKYIEAVWVIKQKHSLN